MKPSIAIEIKVGTVFVFNGQTYCCFKQPFKIDGGNFLAIELTATHQTASEIILDANQEILILGEAEF